MDTPTKKTEENASTPPPPPETGWEYKPGGRSGPAFDTAADASASAPYTGESVEWTASEYVAHHRGSGWYAAFGGLTLALAAAIYLVTNDLFSAIFSIAIMIVAVIAVSQKPRVIKYVLDGRGLTVGRTFYAYGSFKAFSIITEDALEKIVFTPLHRFMPPLSIYFAPEDEPRIIAALSSRLPLEPASQSLFDAVMRKMRF